MWHTREGTHFTWFRIGEIFLPGFLNMSTSVLDWKQNIIHQLKLRNKREQEPFENLIQSYNKYFDIASNLKSKNVQLTVEVEKLKDENLSLQFKAEHWIYFLKLLNQVKKVLNITG